MAMVSIEQSSVDSSLPPDEVRLRLRTAHEAEDAARFDILFYLRAVHKGRYYLQYGFSSLRDYAEAELGLTPRQTEDRLRIARALVKLPRLRTGFQMRKIAYSAVREITRVAEPATERDWLQAALERPVSEVQRLVAASRDGEVPDDSRFGLPRRRIKVTCVLEPEELALVQTVCQKLSHERGHPVSVHEALLIGMQYLHESDAAKLPRRNGRTPRPDLVFVRCPHCRSGAVATDEGFVSMPEDRLDEVEAAARILVVDAAVPDGAVSEETEPGEAVPEETKCGEAVSGKAAPEDGVAELTAPGSSPPSTTSTPHALDSQRDQPTSPRLALLVLARDGYRCQVPHCSRRVQLHAHHIQWRLHGGRTRLDNLITVCHRHHGMIHTGALVVGGSVSRGVDFSGDDGSPYGPHVGDETSARIMREIEERIDPAELETVKPPRGGKATGAEVSVTEMP